MLAGQRLPDHIATPADGQAAAEAEVIWPSDGLSLGRLLRAEQEASL